MIRQTQEDMKSIALLHDDKQIVATHNGKKWVADLVIPNYAIIRMRSDRKQSREFANIESLMKACEGMADKLVINLNK